MSKKKLIAASFLLMCTMGFSQSPSQSIHANKSIVADVYPEETPAVNSGVEGNVYGNNTFTNYGVSSEASGAPVNYAIYGFSTGSNSFAGYFDGNVHITGTLTFPPSDRKLKKNLVEVTHSLEKILHLHPLEYEYQTEAFPTINLPSGKQTGFIAQELQEVFPELVNPIVHSVRSRRNADGSRDSNKTENTEFLGINSIALIPILTAGIQEQQLIIEDQNTRIRKLETSLENQVLRMQQKAIDTENEIKLLRQQMDILISTTHVSSGKK